MTVEELIEQYVSRHRSKSAEDPTSADARNEPLDASANIVAADQVYRGQALDEHGLIARNIEALLAVDAEKPIDPASFIALLERLQRGEQGIPGHRSHLSPNDTVLMDTAQDLLQEWRRVST